MANTEEYLRKLCTELGQESLRYHNHYQDVFDKLSISADARLHATSKLLEVQLNDIKWLRAQCIKSIVLARPDDFSTGPDALRKLMSDLDLESASAPRGSEAALHGNADSGTAGEGGQEATLIEEIAIASPST